MTEQQLTDELVLRARAGDPDALRAVYVTLSPVVLGYLRARGVPDPEGVTGDVFLALLPRIATVRGGAAGLRTLTFSIAHARVVDDYRARSRRPDPVPYDADADRRTSASAEDEAEAAGSVGRVLAVLDVLPADQREVVVLRVVADLSLEQVAEIMGRSTGAVKQLQRRGLLAVRRVLEQRQVTG